MTAEVPKVAPQQEPPQYKEKPPRTERVEAMIDLRHKGVRTGVAAGGLLALVGLAAVLLN